jgi:hypothetical protein
LTKEVELEARIKKIKKGIIAVDIEMSLSFAA